MNIINTNLQQVGVTEHSEISSWDQIASNTTRFGLHLFTWGTERTGERKVRKGHSVTYVKQMGDLADDACSWINQIAFKQKSRWLRKEWYTERVSESNYSACAVHLALEAKQLWCSCITRLSYSSSILAAWNVPVWIHRGLLIWHSHPKGSAASESSKMLLSHWLLVVLIGSLQCATKQLTRRLRRTAGRWHTLLLKRQRSLKYSRSSSRKRHILMRVSYVNKAKLRTHLPNDSLYS